MQLHSPPESWSIAIQGARLNRYGRVNNSPLAPTLLFLLMTNDKNMKSPTYLDTILLRTHTISICYLLCLFPTVSSVMNDTTVNCQSRSDYDFSTRAKAHSAFHH